MEHRKHHVSSDVISLTDCIFLKYSKQNQLYTVIPAINLTFLLRFHACGDRQLGRIQEVVVVVPHQFIIFCKARNIIKLDFFQTSCNAYFV